MAIGELRAHLVLLEIQVRQRVTEAGGDGAAMGAGELLRDGGAERSDSGDWCLGGERDSTSGIAQYPRGFGSDHSRPVDKDPWGGRNREGGAHTKRIVQRVKVRHLSAVQGCGAGDA